MWKMHKGKHSGKHLHFKVVLLLDELNKCYLNMVDWTAALDTQLRRLWLNYLSIPPQEHKGTQGLII